MLFFIFMLIGIILCIYLVVKFDKSKDNSNDFLDIKEDPDPQLDNLIYERGLTKDGFPKPINLNLDGNMGTSGPCFYPDQFVAVKTISICTVPSGCLPNYSFGEIIIKTQLSDPKNYKPCSDGGDLLGLMQVNGQCLQYDTNLEKFSFESCDISNNNQLWGIKRFDINNKPADNGIIAKIRHRSDPTQYLGLYSGNEIDNSSNGKLGFGSVAESWAITPNLSYGYQGASDTDFISSSLPPQLAFLGEIVLSESNFNDLAGRLYCLKNTNGTAGTDLFFLPTYQTPQKPEQSFKFIDYRYYFLKLNTIPGINF